MESKKGFEFQFILFPNKIFYIRPDQNEFGVSQLRKYYGITVLIIQFVLPAIICIVCYWTIGYIKRFFLYFFK